MSAQHGFSDHFQFTFDKIEHPVLFAGEGPPVLLMHELPGPVEQFWQLAQWIKEAGFTVYVPLLYAKTADENPELGLLGSVAKICITREIHLFANNHSSPITSWLRALARQMHTQSNSKIGVIGLCMTGNFALSLVIEPSVVAPVASEPALPLNLFSKKSREALHLNADEKVALRERKNIDIMCLRFKGDPSCTKLRFDALQDIVGEKRMRRIELDDSDKNPKGNPFPHAVLTADLIDEEGSATIKARDEVIAFLQEKLCP